MLRARYDDAFVLCVEWLGELVIITAIRWRVFTSAAREAKQFETFDLPSTGLCNGSNVLAVRLVNHSSQSSDIVWDANLLAGSATTSGRERPPGQRGFCVDPICRMLVKMPSRSVGGPVRPCAAGRLLATYWSRKERFYIEPLPTTEHSVRLSVLKPCRNHYKYSIDGMEAVYDLRRCLRIQPYRFWIIGDSGTGSIENARAVYDAYSKFTGDRPTDVWLMLGDNAYGYGTDQEFQNAVFNLYTPLLHTTCLWPARTITRIGVIKMIIR